MTAAHRRLVAGPGMGWALDAMDVRLVSFILAALAVQWSLSPGELSLVASIGFVGMAVGAGLGGLLADRVGRRSVFTLTLLVYGLAAGASALSTGVAMLLVLRFITGLGLGAELPVASTLVGEYAPGSDPWPDGGDPRVVLGRRLGLRCVDRLLGGPVVGEQVALGVRPRHAAGGVRDRRPLEAARIGAIPGAPWPDSPKPRPPYSGSRPPAGWLRSRRPTHPPITDVRPSLAQLWTPRYRVRTVALWLTWFGVNFAYYGAFIWLPTLLVASGFGLVKSFEYTLIITLAQLPGYAVAAVLIERWGRRATLVTFLAGSALAAAVSASRRRCLPSSPPGSPCRSSTWAPGAQCAVPRRSIPPRSGPLAPAAPPPSAGSRRSWLRWSYCPSEVAGNLGLFTVFAVAFGDDRRGVPAQNGAAASFWTRSRTPGPPGRSSRVFRRGCGQIAQSVVPALPRP